ncbi:class I SAM-dependent methyltransferase [Coralliovum pocilloporae]|uniref:class I SAM-dependent methyltransferase n=1 Tax=Coralliovum pocilloporae TaxID=3066369 RepID=UPI00330744DE
MVAIDKGKDRFSIIEHLSGTENIGIELGVASGGYSARMVQSGKFQRFFGVDVYGDHHNHEEYKAAVKRVGLEGNYTLLKMFFDEALGLFPDDYFDFIYIDGYAHSGEEGGKTFFDWLPKLKSGGIMAGDDYSERWPLVIQSVTYFAEQTGAEITLTDPDVKGPDAVFDQSPTWYITNTDLKTDWQRNAQFEEQGKALGAQTRDRHKQTMMLGQTFEKLLHTAMTTDDPAVIRINGKNVYVVAK